MKRAVTLAVAAITLIGTPAATAHQQHASTTGSATVWQQAAAPQVKNGPDGPCDLPWRFLPLTDPSVRARIHFAVRRLIRCAVARWPVEGGIAKAQCIALHESGDWPWAVGGDNYGVFQISSWPDRRDYWLAGHLKAWHLADAPWSNARANILVGIRWAHSAGWSAWSTAGSC